MCFGKRIINIKGPLYRALCHQPGLYRRQSAVLYDIGVGQSGICRGIVGVYADRLLKVLDAFLQTFFGSLVPEIAPLEVGLVGLGVDRMSARQASLPLRRQLDSNLIGNSPRHLVL